MSVARQLNQYWAAQNCVSTTADVLELAIAKE